MSTNPVVTMELASGGTLKIELFPDKAPNTVNNFISLIENGFYDGLIFHRVIPDFMIQGGDPRGTGTGGPGYAIEGEFSGNAFVQNDLEHKRGVISMARSASPNSAGSQFFIMVADAPHLDGQYAAFGRVTEGMEYADQVVSAKRDSRDRPLEEQKISKASVELFGQEYSAPQTM